MQLKMLKQAQKMQRDVEEAQNDLERMELSYSNNGVDVVARYRDHDTLLSGWAIGQEYLHGKAGVVSARVGKGRIFLFGIDATYRGQPLGTIKMFFQGILTANEELSE